MGGGGSKEKKNKEPKPETTNGDPSPAPTPAPAPAPAPAAAPADEDAIDPQQMEEEATNEAEEAMKAAMAAQKKSEAVAAQKASEAVKKNSIKDLLYNSTDFPLAKPGNDHLRDIVRTTGFKAIDALASVVLSTFENSGRGVKLQGAETARLTAVIGLSKTVTDVLEWDEFPDVAAFVSEIVRHIKSNAILVGAAAVWWERRRADDIQLTTKEREELRLSGLWCFLMHAVCKKAIFQPMDSENCIYQQIVTDFAEKRKEGAAVWEKYGFDFEKMKGSCVRML